MAVMSLFKPSGVKVLPVFILKSAFSFLLLNHAASAGLPLGFGSGPGLKAGLTALVGSRVVPVNVTAPILYCFPS